MFQQHQILRTLSTPESREQLDRVLVDTGLAHRTAMARRVCEAFGFVNAKGAFQVASCRKALVKLAVRGAITLPASCNTHASTASPRLLDQTVPMPAGLPPTVEQVEGLSLVVVRDSAQRAVWNTLLHNEHPRGTTTFVGSQVRYLITSAHGYLGALGFSAPALRLKDRERWMSWSDTQRQAYLHRVVCLSRFLTRGACRNLASHVLGRALSRLVDDFEARYGYRPWVVETYVDPAWPGTCFKAANFLHIGYTAGGDRRGKPELPKALYVHELDRRWRGRLGVADRPTREPHEGLDRDHWAENEFGGAPLGDKRLSTRLVKSATLLADVVGHAITAHTSHDVAAVKGHYRLLEQPEDSEVSPENILVPHRARTIERMRSQKVVLCLQDGSTLNYATRPACTDLQVIGHNQTSAKVRGLPIHVTLATTADGLPLGVLRCSYRDPEGGPLAPRSQQWLNGYVDICEAAEGLDKEARVICVMDREADQFALFDAQRQQGRVDVLVRARHDRNLAGGKKLFATLSSGPAACTVELRLQRVTARQKSSGKQPRAGRRARIAHTEVRYHCVKLPSPQAGVPPVKLYGVHVRETSPPPGQAAVQWYLLTSMEVHSAKDAVQILDYYTRRWRIEDFFRVLKSGCKVESMALRTSLRLERAIAVYCVIAWRIMVLTLLGRAVPELSAEVFFTDLELRFLAGYARRVQLPQPDTLQAAILLVAVLGGYQNRSRDGPPGFQIMWRGIDRLGLTTLGYEVGCNVRA